LIKLELATSSLSSRFSIELEGLPLGARNTTEVALDLRDLALDFLEVESRF
jgi:hypothetical protein